MARRTRGTGEVFKEGAGWAVRWRESNRRKYRGGFAARSLAEKYLARVRGELAAGRQSDDRPAPALSLGSLAEGWLERRQRTHRAAREDGYRWKNHLGPTFGKLSPADVDTGTIRAFIEAQLAKGANPGTVKIYVAILSALFVDLMERGLAESNPAREIPKSVRRLIRPTHDPRTTPFLERAADIRRVYLDLPAPLNLAYAIGALAGLRTGEVFALRWEHVDLAARRIHVRESVKGPLKDKDSRIVPILDSLHPVLAAAHLKTGADGRVVPSMTTRAIHVSTKGTPGKFLKATLAHLGLAREGLGWYEATRHTFASQWVMGGGSIEVLKEILGHHSVVVTERYAHLKPDHFPATTGQIIGVDLSENGQISARRLGKPLGRKG
jgi:integrase